MKRSHNFHDLVLTTCFGVSPIQDVSMRLAYHAGKLSRKGVMLDMGTGTGIIALYLQSRGWMCIAADNNEFALRCARKNAEANKMTLEVRHSDLFSNISETFDLIVFSPPCGHMSKFPAQVELLKWLIPKKLTMINIFVKRARLRLVHRFLDAARRHLRENGSVMVLLYPSDFDLNNAIWEGSILEEVRDMRIVLLKVRHDQIDSTRQERTLQ